MGTLAVVAAAAAVVVSVVVVVTVVVVIIIAQIEANFQFTYFYAVQLTSIFSPNFTSVTVTIES
jgi:hypothetical protein